MASLNRNGLLLILALLSTAVWSTRSSASLASTEEQLTYAREAVVGELKKEGLTFVPGSMSIKPSGHVMKYIGEAFNSMASWMGRSKESDVQVVTFRATNHNGDPFNVWTYLLTAHENAYCSGSEHCEWIKNHSTAKRFVTSIHNEGVLMRLVHDITPTDYDSTAKSLHISAVCDLKIENHCLWGHHPY